jgi:hypothetical protein
MEVILREKGFVRFLPWREHTSRLLFFLSHSPFAQLRKIPVVMALCLFVHAFGPRLDLVFRFLCRHTRSAFCAQKIDACSTKIYEQCFSKCLDMQDSSAPPAKLIPITLLSGFLGAGLFLNAYRICFEERQKSVASV